MAITNIKSVTNHHSTTWYVRNREHEDDTGGVDQYAPINARGTFFHDMWIPWADGEGDVRGVHRIVITTVPQDPLPPGEFTIFQSGDFVWFSRDGSFANRQPVPGNSTVGGDRSVEISGTNLDDAEVRFF